MHIGYVSRLCLAVVALIGSTGGAVVAAANTPSIAAAASPSGPQCTFNGSAFPIVVNATPGEKVAVACTGLGPLHPYLFMETSLLLAIDPAAKPLLTGHVVSLPGLISLLDSLPEINPAALSFPLSDLSGTLKLTYTLPTSQASDPNAVCPPTTAQINAGLPGCGLAMIDLTSFTPVGAGSVLVNYAGDPLLPPAPTLVASTVKTTPGATVSVGDAPGATTFWWLSTLSALGALLGGGAPPAPTVTVTLKHGKSTVTAANNITVSSAVYNPPVLTPPKISGGFTVPPGLKGGEKVTVTYGATILGLPLTNSATTHINVR